MLGTIDRSLTHTALVPPGQTVRDTFNNGQQVKVHVTALADIPAGSSLALIPGYPERFATILAVIPPQPTIELPVDTNEIVNREVKA